MSKKKIKVTKESETGRNEKFLKPNGKEVTRAQLVKEIKKGEHPGYHIRKINGVDTPVSNPDENSNNNLD